MFKKLLQKLLRRPVTRLANRLSSAPVKKDVFESLDIVLKGIRDGNDSFGPVLPYDINNGRFIIFSDQHKGARDLADDFALAEKNYTAALDYYYSNDYTFINLGDCEELWENTPDTVMKINKTVLQSEARFLQQNKYYRIFGNHDLEWKYPFQQLLYLKPLFGDTLKIYEGIELQTQHNNKTYSIFLTHGHQGDKRSDGNPFSMWVVAAIWTPIQRFLDININVTADSFELIDTHNIIMYDWSATQKQLIFISGHTHKPVFASLDHIDLLNHQLQAAQVANDPEAIRKIEADLAVYAKQYAGKKFVKSMAYPSYFNSGCCCFDDGDISGIEIEGGYIRLVKWETSPDGSSVKKILEQSPLSYIFDQLPG
ncbi:MAG: metallophosphoesterase [Chitinophagaceae bacterium]